MDEKLVYIQKRWENTDLLRQTPGHSGRWDNIRFSEEPVTECDYVVIINEPSADIDVVCPPDNVWAIIQEPPNEVFKRLHRGRRQYARTYTTDPRRSGDRFIHAPPAVPWHLEREYDWLRKATVPTKTQSLSWITSARTSFRGHKARMQFLANLQDSVDFNLFGRGFTEIPDKWDALAPYRYSLAIENYSNPWYWTEKIADCFLAWTMPIYYGCTRIAEYFPAESFVQIDISQPDVVERIADALRSDRWLKNRDAIEYARQLVLDKYQLFPFLAAEIQEREASLARNGKVSAPVQLHIPAQPLTLRAENAMLNAVYRIRKLFNPNL